MRLLLLIILLVTCSPISGQIKDRNVTREIIIQNSDSIIKFKILTNNPKKQNPDNTIRYYWFHNDQINSNYGGFSGNLLHGKYELLCDGKLIISGQFEYGLKSGTWYTWSNKGSIKRKVDYKKGIKDGYFIKTDKEELKIIGRYRKGKLHGKVKYISDDSTYNIKYKNGIKKEDGESIFKALNNKR